MNKLITKDIVNIVNNMCDIIIRNEVYFCDLDSPAGDGDFGMSLSKGFKQLRSEWEDISNEDIGKFLKGCGMIITEHCGGASGPIWGSAFRSAGKYANGKLELSLKEFAETLQSAADGIQKIGGAKLGDKTLLDALIPAIESLKVSANGDEEILEAMKKSAKEAVIGAENTKKIVASKGRATYVGERSLDHPDAGATAIGIIFTEVVENLIKS
ncbi:dihydroxyacetone kinase subunit L [Clostridium tagluense]|nr:dihydroxyacetone kinase subunit L [Clostridium tagluense]